MAEKRISKHGKVPKAPAKPFSWLGRKPLEGEIIMRQKRDEFREKIKEVSGDEVDVEALFQKRDEIKELAKKEPNGAKMIGSLLLDDDANVSYVALQILDDMLMEKCDLKEALPFAARALGEPDSTVSWGCAQIIYEAAKKNKSGMTAYVVPLGKALWDTSVDTRANAAKALAEIAKSDYEDIKDAVVGLFAVLDDVNDAVRIAAITAIRRAAKVVEGKGFGENILAAVFDAKARKELSLHGRIAKVADMLGDKNPEVRAEAARALINVAEGGRSIRVAVPKLLERLYDGEPEIVSRSGVALAYAATGAEGKLRDKILAGVYALSQAQWFAQEAEANTKRYVAAVLKPLGKYWARWGRKMAEKIVSGTGTLKMSNAIAGGKREPLTGKISEYRELLLDGKGWKLRAMAEESKSTMEKLRQLANDTDYFVSRRAKQAIAEAEDGGASRAALARRWALTVFKD